MEYAVYVLGVCLLAFTGAVTWATLVVRRTVSDFKAAVAKVPEAVALAGNVVSDVNATAVSVGELVANAREVIPNLSDSQVTDKLWKGVGEGGAQALKTFSMGLFGGEKPAPEASQQS